MTYSIDLRKRVVEFVEAGGSKVEAAARFSVHRQTIYQWLGRDVLTPKKHGERRRKIDKKALQKEVEQNPDMTLRERAAKFGVCPEAIRKSLKKLGISHKKNAALPRKKP